MSLYPANTTACYRTADKEAPVSTLSFRAKSALSKPATRRVKVIFTVLARDKNQRLNTRGSVAEGFLTYNWPGIHINKGNGVLKKRKDQFLHWEALSSTQVTSKAWHFSRERAVSKRNKVLFWQLIINIQMPRAKRWAIIKVLSVHETKLLSG